ncbi:conserved hypothetical protein [Imperialibacter sp. EC-SDR9]|nr:conserved hypothetical protein [Imperialibacter sp. 75]CAD5295114.1 conserved hypothetical protein [Imperialibacter sp. 89]VVT12226.1 conserved hypothetical protein [Imperialibacter sp. EC-SDR9]
MMHHGDMHPNDQHFDYMLVKVPEDKEHMILVNVTEGSHKAGAVFVKKVSIQITSNKIVVKLEALKEALGESFDYCYLIT